MLSEARISGFRGVVDFYYYMGLACARRWPRSPGRRRAPQVQAGWPAFTQAVHLWDELPQHIRDPFNSMSSGTALSGRDLFMRAYMAGIPLLYDLPHSPIPTSNKAYWAIIDWYKLLLDDGFAIYTKTDTPCHLWLCWTNTPPVQHIDPVYRRGIYMHGNPRFCFVAYNCFEQAEVGDTLTHSWVFHNWKECEYRWFTFHGEVAGVASPSTYAIDQLHFGYKLAESLPFDLWNVPVNKNYVEHAIFKPAKGGHPDHLRLKLGRKGEPGWLRLSLHHLDTYGYPHKDAIAVAYQKITGMPEEPYAGLFTFQFYKGVLNPKLWYALRAECDAVPPVTVNWRGWPNHPQEDTYLLVYRTYDNTWWTYRQNHLNYLIRGTLA